MTPTRWATTVSEWVTPSTASFSLNFFPSNSPPNVYDAWTSTRFTNFTYNATNNIITLNDSSNAPSQLVASNLVYLGCDQGFTNSNGGFVPALSAETLAGVPVNVAFVDTIRSSLSNALAAYVGTNASSCADTSTNGSSTSVFTPISNGLLLPQHFTEMATLSELLTNAMGSSQMSNDTATITGAAQGTYTSGAYDFYSANVTSKPPSGWGTGYRTFVVFNSEGTGVEIGRVVDDVAYMNGHAFADDLGEFPIPSNLTYEVTCYWNPDGTNVVTAVSTVCCDYFLADYHIMFVTYGCSP
jgi:hypothetical protein